MAKATHYGTCQVCGRNQKLPSGKLSNHGYTKQWGFFAGTCTGSGHLPFEQSIDLIEQAIKDAKQRSYELTSEASALDADCGGQVWMKVHIRGTAYVRTHTRWMQFPIEQVRDENGRICMMTPEGERKLPLAGSTIEGLNRRRVEHLEREARRYDSYVKWQRERIEGWQPTELRSIEEAA